jgi:ferredoxin
MTRVPVVELSQCNLCEGCVAACPEVFRRNEAGYMEVVECDVYPEECVEDAIRNCPEQCIAWVDVP